MNSAPHNAIAALPQGKYAVGVSGGADSMALLCLLLERADLHVHVVHLDHQTRGQESRGDSDFVESFCLNRKIPITTETRSALEPQLHDLPTNPSARYRAIRFALFERVIREQDLSAIILAHHADDQAETVLLRLLRGTGWPSLGAIRQQSNVGPVRVLRPLLDVRRSDLRAYLQSIHQPWREDSSNASDDYQRNRVRKFLSAHERIVPLLLNIARSARQANDLLTTLAPQLGDAFATKTLADIPRVLQEQSAMQWLLQHSPDPRLVDSSSIARLIDMATDASTASRQTLPGPMTIRRSQGRISLGD